MNGIAQRPRTAPAAGASDEARPPPPTPPQAFRTHRGARWHRVPTPRFDEFCHPPPPGVPRRRKPAATTSTPGVLFSAAVTTTGVVRAWVLGAHLGHGGSQANRAIPRRVPGREAQTAPPAGRPAGAWGAADGGTDCDLSACGHPLESQVGICNPRPRTAANTSLRLQLPPAAAPPPPGADVWRATTQADGPNGRVSPRCRSSRETLSLGAAVSGAAWRAPFHLLTGWAPRPPLATPASSSERRMAVWLRRRSLAQAALRATVGPWTTSSPNPRAHWGESYSQPLAAAAAS